MEIHNPEDERYPFLIRIKKNIIYDTVKKYAHSRLIRFRHILELCLITLKVQWRGRDYVTDVFYLPEEYIYWIYDGQ